MNVPPSGSTTFLFTDIEGSTRLWEQFPDQMTGALERHDTILRMAIGSSGGTVVKTTGDGVMAVFGSATDALAASLAAQRGLTREPWSDTGPLRARMGVHTGQADQRGGDFFGPAVNRTARIMAAGHGGQVLLSASAAELCEEALPAGASLIDLGEHRLKDLGRPERVFQLVHPDLASSFPPLATLRPPGANLPSMAGELVGRQVELEEVKARLRDAEVRLLTLIGPPGSGKTTIAIRVAGDLSPDFADGACFVDLAGARDTDAVLVAIARAIGVDEVVDRPVQAELVDRLRERRILLVVDNFEQVAKAAGAVAELLHDCPRLTVLATSREALHIRAEHVYPVPPLALPPLAPARATAAQIEAFEAIQLFVGRARVVRPDFRLTDENAAAVVEICRRLDGLPLAIELAAARLRLFPPEVLRDRLGDRLGLLRSGLRDLPERQQTLRATMDWSYDLLDPGEQRLFELLSVFADAEIPAVEVVAERVGDVDGVALDVLEGLAGLVEKSLVRQVEHPGWQPRVTMLETIREFAADRLAQRPDLRARARREHAIHYADEARRFRAELTGNRREVALATMTAEIANLRIAWAYWVAGRDLEQLDKLADSLLILNDARGWYLDTVGLATDMLAVLETSASTADRVGQEIALRTALARALMATRGFTPEVEDALASAVELFERGGNVRQQYSVLRGLAGLYQFRAQFDKVERLGREILAMGERERDPRMLLNGHLLVGATVGFIDDLAGGLDHLDRAIALFATEPTHARAAGVGNDSRVACFTTSGFMLWLTGYPDRAVERMNAALALAAELEHPFTDAYARFHSGLLHQWRREPQIAADRAAGLLELADEHEFRIWTAAGGCLLGAAQVELGRIEEGLANIRDGTDLYQGLRSPPVFWPMLLRLAAEADHRAGRHAASLAPIEAAIELMSPEPGTVILPELHLLKGDIVAGMAADEAGGRLAAEPWYRRAFDRAGQLDARMTRLRAATRLGRLALARGEPDEAARVIGPVLASFTEGFSTADFLEAQDLLATASSA